MKLAKDIFLLSCTPLSIFYPIPLIQLFIFALSGNREIGDLINTILFTFPFFAAVNLFNHVNDIEEDLLAGKNNIFSDKKIRNLGLIIVLVLYSSSILFYFSIKSEYIIYPIITLIFTWLYSDKIVFGRYIKRLKEHYITEVLTYTVTAVTFALSIWFIVSDFNVRAYCAVAVVLFINLWTVFLKDLKDVSSDKLAGLYTMAVKFSPETLYTASTVILIALYLSIFLFSMNNILPRPAILVSFVGFFPATVLIKLVKSEWDFASVHKYIRIIPQINILSLVFLTVIIALKF
ncbi:hypothetical protein Asulf_00475 [Archaeoglobus sulfaticallidus PM70-1]|uniref:4-hydroxybenzoate polyprenyltransferase-related prenyltransferase n=1 Tax=Archaeoglobus sulfaticallidus PM70-1 TaxID=387631 RepID=N0BE69_9EURY|nr:UbiA family prenyltransferase [Archaeoglobus sulfaticallidus]AGK60502.1 hypothetical protein Asulf_00475 [Archaeoglobus sulfaticallidus PM70-1]